MKKKTVIFSFVILILTAAIIVGVKLSKKAEYVEKVDPTTVQNAFNLLNNDLDTPTYTYIDFLRDNVEKNGTENISAMPTVKDNTQTENEATLKFNESAKYNINVNEKGLFNINIEYLVEQYSLSDVGLKVKINGVTQYNEMDTIGLKLLYVDETKELSTNSFGDQSPPLIKRVVQWQNGFFYDNTFKTADPLLFLLDKGENVIEITNISQEVILGKLEVMPRKTYISYDEYSKNNVNNNNNNLKPTYINAISYIDKNSTDVILVNGKNIDITPISPEYNLINLLVYEYSGSNAAFNIEVPEDGNYAISLKTATDFQDFENFVTIKIDGEIPFSELVNYRIKATDDNFLNQIIADYETEKPYYFYLTKGVHKVDLTLEKEPLMEVSRNLKLIVDHINQLTFEVNKITGKDIDEKRSWNFTKFMPEIVDYLNAYDVLLQDSVYQLQKYSPSGTNAYILSDVDNMLVTLEKLKEYPNDFPLYMDSFSSGSNSLLQMVGLLMNYIDVPVIALDGLYIASDSEEIDISKKSFADKTKYNLQVLGATFTSEKYNGKVDDSVLNVWVASRSIMEIDILQKIADTTFTPKSGTKVKFSIMADPNKLVMAAASNSTPDAALGLPSHMPFDLSSRGALYDLTNYPDFWEVAGRFPPGTLVSQVYNGGIYSLPEMIDFNVLIYRTDIFNKLNLQPPNTWQDTIDLLPELQRYGMNFYHNAAEGTGYKWIYQTGPMMLQHNAKMFSEDGLRTRINEPEGVAGLGFLGELFTKYSLPTEVPSFYDAFKYGKLPIGIASSINYRQIKYMSPELDGQWKIAPLPGTEQEDGSISRWYVAGTQNSLIFENSEKKDEAWELIKWWTDTEAQVTYANTLSSSFGQGNLWISSNIEALKNINLPIEDRNVILEQTKWIREVQRTPGQYMLERSISDIWNKIVMDGESPQVASDKMVIPIQRELRRKMIEFGYIDENGKQLKPYVLKDIDWIEENIKEAKNK